MSQRLKRWEREEVAQVSRAWVDQNCRHRVTERDLQLARILVRRRLLRRDQIGVLVPGFRGLSKVDALVNRRLRVLFDCHVLDRAFPRVLPGCGSSQAVVALDRAGAILLDAPFKRLIRHEQDRSGRIHRVLPLDYLHTLGVNDFEVSLVRWCLASSVELLRWRVDFENVRRFQFNGERQLRPDGFGILRYPDGSGKAFFLEYDTGSEDIRARNRFKKLTEKFKAYAAFKASGAWMQEDWARLLRDFPLLVFLTEDARRVAPLREITTTLGLRSMVDLFSNRQVAIEQIRSR